MEKPLIAIDKVRAILGDKAKGKSDEEISKLVAMLTILCEKAIERVINAK